MISLQKLFGKSDVFYDLLKQSAAAAQESVQALHDSIGKPGSEQNLERLKTLRRKDKEITTRIDEALCKTFVTELEREDIEALSVALYKIPKTAEKIAERYMISAAKVADTDFSRLMTLMDSAAKVLVRMVDELCAKMHLEEVKKLNAELQGIEGEADKHAVELLRGLYTTETDAIKVVILRDLYDLMEKVIDRCRDAGNVLSHIVLKYT